MKHGASQYTVKEVESASVCGFLSLYKNLRDVKNKSQFSLSERSCEMDINACVALMDRLNSDGLYAQRNSRPSALLLVHHTQRAGLN